MKRLAAWVVLTGVAVAVGFGLALGFIYVANAFLPPFRPNDDDTWREFGPVLVAYAIWGVSSLTGAVLAWRCVRDRF